MAPFARIQWIAALVSSPPENASPTFSPLGSFCRMFPMRNIRIAESTLQNRDWLHRPKAPLAASIPPSALPQDPPPPRAAPAHNSPAPPPPPAPPAPRQT